MSATILWRSASIRTSTTTITYTSILLVLLQALICCYYTSSNSGISITRVDAFVGTTISINRRTTSKICHSHIITSAKGNIGNIGSNNGRLPVKARNSFYTRQIGLYANSKEDGEEASAVPSSSSSSSNINYIAKLIQSKLDNCLTPDQIKSILQHQPKAMKLNNSILSSQEEITAKRIDVAAVILDWFLTSTATATATTTTTAPTAEATTSTQNGFTISQVAKIITGHPPILSYDIETNVIPTVGFYNNALMDILRIQRVQQTQRQTTSISSSSSSSSTSSSTSISSDSSDGIDPGTVTFLCKHPKLLEFNVKKRLKPRFEAYKETMAVITEQQDGTSNDDSKGNNKREIEMKAAEETLKIIATKTDSRYREWLLELSPSLLQQPLPGEDETNEHESFEEEHNINDNDLPSSYVILSNLQSGMNIGNILRSASIFGCTECIVVGQKRHRLTGDHGSRFDLPRRHFYTHEEAKSYLKAKANTKANDDEEEIKIYGIEIMENASPLMKYDAVTGVVTFPFGNRFCHSGTSTKTRIGAAFVMGNEGLGLSERQKEICDDFIFIPQTRGGASSSSSPSPTSRDERGNGRGSASLNVSCAAAIILQAYSVWANYPVASMEGEKFIATS